MQTGELDPKIFDTDSYGEFVSDVPWPVSMDAKEISRFVRDDICSLTDEKNGRTYRSHKLALEIATKAIETDENQMAKTGDTAMNTAEQKTEQQTNTNTPKDNILRFNKVRRRTSNIDVEPDDTEQNEEYERWFNKLEYGKNLELDKHQRVRATIDNLTEIMMGDPRFGKISKDVLNKSIVARDINVDAIPDEILSSLKSTYTSLFTGKRYIPLSSACITVIRGILGRSIVTGGYGVSFSERDVSHVAEMISYTNEFNPIVDILDDLKWDGVSRIDTVFTDYGHAADTSYNRAVSRLLMLGAVARAYEPGIKFDYMTIIEGTQGAGKSLMVEALGMGFATEYRNADMDNAQRFVESTAGAWFVEVPEINAMKNSTVDGLKASITCREDHVRLAYKQSAETYKRTCVLIGTTNETAYLSDQTGNRRFLPVRCNGSIDIDRLKADLPQIYAEAVTIYKQLSSQGEVRLVLPDDIRSEASDQQAMRMKDNGEDAMAGPLQKIQSYIAMRRVTADDEFDLQMCSLEIWSNALERNPSDLDGNRRGAMEITDMMARLGYQKSANSIRTRLYGKQRVFDVRK